MVLSGREPANITRSRVSHTHIGNGRCDLDASQGDDIKAIANYLFRYEQDF